MLLPAPPLPLTTGSRKACRAEAEVAVMTLLSPSKRCSAAAFGMALKA